MFSKRRYVPAAIFFLCAMALYWALSGGLQSLTAFPPGFSRDVPDSVSSPVWTGAMVAGKNDEVELEELTNILKSRLDNYTGRVLNWREKVCDSTMVGATPCFDAACPQQFSASIRERLKQVLSLRSSLPEKYMPAVRASALSVTSHKYIFVTGASSNHFYEMQYLLRTMHDNFLPRFEGEDYLLVVYDLGLTQEERTRTENNCGCTVLEFPLSVFPEEFLYLKCTVWRPLLVSALLEKAEYVMWSDASIRFRQSDPFPETFLRARDFGMQSRINGGSIAVRTNPATARFYGDELCQYSAFTEMEANLFIVHNDRFTWEVIMKPWLSCTVTKNCQCLEDYKHRLVFCKASNETRVYGECHRTQSAYGMILSKLYLDKRPMLHVNGVDIQRSTKTDWFTLR